MILERAEHPDWLSNAYLIAEGAGGSGVFVDPNGATAKLTDRVERDGIEVTHVLLTHHHFDHVVGAADLAARYEAPVLAHPLAADLLEDVVTETIDDGATVRSGGLAIEAVHTPGHCADHLALLVDGSDCLTADVLFKGTVGGTRTQGPDGFADLRASIMDRLMRLAAETRVHPGHSEPTTVRAEWESNPFIRVWRGLDPEGAEPCTVGPPDAADRAEATLVVWAPDYDGGNKAWVRFPSGEDAIVGGSQVRRG